MSSSISHSRPGITAAYCCLCAILCGCDSGFGTSTAVENGITTQLLPPRIVDEAENIEYTFDVRNPTRKSVRITDVQKSCSCSKALLSSELIAPNSDVKLKVSANVQGHAGRFATEVKLHNDLGPPWRYRLETQLYHRVVFSPESLQLGGMLPGESKTIHVRLSVFSKDTSPPMPIILNDANDRIAITIDEEFRKTLDGGIQQLQLLLALEITCIDEGQAMYAEIIAAVPGVSDQCRSKLRLYSHRIESYVVQPPRLFLQPDAENHGGKVACVKIKRFDMAPFHIESIKFSERADGADWSLSSHGETLSEHTLCARVHDADMNRYFYRDLVVQVDTPDREVIRIPVAAVK